MKINNRAETSLVAIILVIVVVIGVIGAYIFLPSNDGNNNKPEDTVVEFFQHLNNGEKDEAYHLTILRYAPPERLLMDWDVTYSDLKSIYSDFNITHIESIKSSDLNNAENRDKFEEQIENAEDICHVTVTEWAVVKFSGTTIQNGETSEETNQWPLLKIDGSWYIWPLPYRGD